MSQTRRRKGNRAAAKSATPIVIFAYGLRIEGRVLDTSESGLRVLLPAESGLAEQQLVRIQLNRERQMAKIVRVQPGEEADEVGLKLQ